MNAVANITCPDGVKLDVSRVGSTFASPQTIRKGETVEFYYCGGSQNGTRTVLVMKSDNKGIEGISLDSEGGYRRYNDGSVSSNYTVVKPFVTATPTNEIRVRFDSALEKLAASLPGEVLAELYLKHAALQGESATFDATTGEVVVKLPQPKTAKFVKPTSNNEMEIENTKGERLKIWPWLSGKSGREWLGIDNGNFHTADGTPEQLRDQLVKFLS